MRAVKPLIQNALSRPLLQTTIGNMLGTQLHVSDGQQVSAYFSIPFAEPPIGRLRFETPIRPNYVHTREATKIPEACHKTEDCLYLNLFVPNERSADSNGYPLLVFIPGGGFDKSTCAPHSTPYMAEHYCRRGIAYATLQYRVGLFGFGSDGGSDLQGNYALADVCQALQFLRENCQQIGFDPNRITVAGHSAGASILSALSVSPKSRDLFSQAIQFSGSSLSSISTGNLVVNETQKMINKLSGSKSSISNPKEFLKQFPAKDILTAYKEIGPPMNGMSVIRFSPRVDGDFIPKDYFELIQESPPKPTLNTNSQNEGVVFALFKYLESVAEINHSKMAAFSANDFRQKINDLFISKQIWGQRENEGINEIFDFYANNDQKDNLFYLNCYTRAIHDSYFGVPAKIEMFEKLRNGWPVYNGLFDRLHSAVHPPQIPLKVPTHGSEYLYLFGHLKNSEQLFDETDKQYRDFWIESIVDFVKSGSPKSNKNPQWTQATNENPGPVLRVQDGSPKLEQNLLDKELLFWTRLNKLCGYNIIRQMPLIN